MKSNRFPEQKTQEKKREQTNYWHGHPSLQAMQQICISKNSDS